MSSQFNAQSPIPSYSGDINGAAPLSLPYAAPPAAPATLGAGPADVFNKNAVPEKEKPHHKIWKWVAGSTGAIGLFLLGTVVGKRMNELPPRS